MAVLWWAIAMVAAFYPVLLSGGKLMEGYIGDTRLLNYVLEHDYCWMLGDPHHASLWNPPYFYPQPDVLAYCDLLLGAVPWYAPWRLAGFLPDTAYQWWTATILTLDFTLAWLLLRRLSFSPRAAGAGAFLCAAASPMVSQFGHEQMMAEFYPLLSLLGCVDLVRGVRPARAAAGVVGGVVAQIYTAFYAAWFYAFGLAFVAVVSLGVPAWRRTWLPHWKVLLAAAGVGALAAAPAVAHYLAASQAVGVRPMAEVHAMLPRLQSWFYMGPFSVVYSFQCRWSLFAVLQHDQEHRIGLGLLTTLLVWTGLLGARQRPVVRAFTLAWIGLFAVTLCLPGGFSVWPLIHRLVPGAAALRAIGRVGVATLPVSALGLALWVDRRSSVRWVSLVLCLVVLEQLQFVRIYEKQPVRDDVRTLAQAIPPDAPVFCFLPRSLGPPRSDLSMLNDKWNADAMWASMACGVPTINGLSGWWPPGWALHPLDGPLLDEESALRTWRHQWALGPVAVIQTPIDWDWTDVQLKAYLKQLYPWLRRPGFMRHWRTGLD
jgi:hypothetical protein